MATKSRRDQAWEYRQMLRKQGFGPGEADQLALKAFPDVSYDELNPGHGEGGGIGGLLKSAGKQVVKKATAPFRALGQLAKGDVGDALKTFVGEGLGVHALPAQEPLVDLATGDTQGAKEAFAGNLAGLAVAAPFAAGISALGGTPAIFHGAGLAAGSAAGGAGAGAAGAAGGAAATGAEAAAAGLPTWLKVLLGIGATGLSLHDQSQQRKAAEEFARAQLGLQTRGIELAEQSFAERAPLREAAFSALLQRVQGGPDPTDIFGSFLQRRAAGLPAGFIGGPEPEKVQQRLQQQLPQLQQPQQQPTAAQNLAEAIQAARQPSPQQQLSSVVQAGGSAAQNGSAKQKLRDALIQALM